MGAVFRSDSLHRLTTADLKVMEPLRLRTVIDMRSSSELRLQGCYPLANEVAYHHVPWYEDETRPFKLSKPGDPAPDLASAYLDLARACGPALASVLDLIADADHAVVFHCVAGKDRTGIVAGLVLAVLGVPDASIASDYHLTEGAAPRMRAWAQAHDARALAEIRATPAWVHRAPHESIEAFLHLARVEHGSIDRFLGHVGVDENITEKLRHRLLEP